MRNLLTFLDDPKRGDNRHVTAIIGVVGEDLNAALFAHYLEKGGSHTVTVLNESPRPGTMHGQRLDRWIYAIEHESREEALYQSEIKNWAASAIGGKKLPIECSESDMQAVIEHYWSHQLTTVFQSKKQPNGVTKVLLPMKVPEQYGHVEVEPLVIYWMPVLNPKDKSSRPFFTVSLADLGVTETFPTSFKYLNFFSASLYVRQLLKSGVETLHLSMPNAERRIEVFSEISV